MNVYRQRFLITFVKGSKIGLKTQDQAVKEIDTLVNGMLEVDGGGVVKEVAITADAVKHKPKKISLTLVTFSSPREVKQKEVNLTQAEVAPMKKSSRELLNEVINKITTEEFFQALAEKTGGAEEHILPNAPTASSLTTPRHCHYMSPQDANIFHQDLATEIEWFSNKLKIGVGSEDGDTTLLTQETEAAVSCMTGAEKNRFDRLALGAQVHARAKLLVKNGEQIGFSVIASRGARMFGTSQQKKRFR